MKLQFKKYQGTGNDFVIISGMDENRVLSLDQIQLICDRRFGVGADGLIIVRPAEGYDFEVVYYNSDGSQSFCGNGTRCAVHFAHNLGLFEKETRFLAIDGAHEASLVGDEVALKMNDVSSWKTCEADYELNTGSPHYIRFVEDLGSHDITAFGKSIRYNETYKAEGINVNLVSQEEGGLSMLTYERGVEAETFSCGTGATAAVIAYFLAKGHTGAFESEIGVKGGRLKIKGVIADTVHSVYLIGPAKFVFDGSITV